MTTIVTASTVGQLDSYLRDAYNNNKDYEITLDDDVNPYEVTSYCADDSYTCNPSPIYPYGPPGTERSSLPHINTNVKIKASAGKFATITRDTNVSQTYRHFYVRTGGY